MTSTMVQQAAKMSSANDGGRPQDVPARRAADCTPQDQGRSAAPDSHGTRRIVLLFPLLIASSQSMV